MASEAVLIWHGPRTEPDRWDGVLRCEHGGVTGAYFAKASPDARAQAARGMLEEHQRRYHCECAHKWFAYFGPAGPGERE